VAREARPEHQPHPRYVVWELTLKCDLACRHCGSRAGKARASELDLDEARDVARQLGEMGTYEVTFIGGEAYLHPQWEGIIRAVADEGIRCALTTGARALDRDLAQRAADAGVHAVSISVDGLESTHDHLRAVPGSYRACLRGLEAVAAVGLSRYANTQVNRLNLPELEELAEVLLDHGIAAWQVQLTGPMGRGADRPDWLLQPYEMLDLVPRLAAIATHARTRGCWLQAANNLGYFGPHEGLLRARPWGGCAAGMYTLGIESNGDVKGCPSLPSGPYVGGNLRETSLSEIWEHAAELRFTRDRHPADGELWGYCGRCYYKDICRGGCSWTSHTLLGRRGNMPWCHHRAMELAAEGKRERLEKVEDAPGTPFDFGRYALIEEPLSS